MATSINRIGVLTAGGDCPGLNAVIRAVVKDARYHGLSVVGIEDGFLGLIENRVRELNTQDVSNLLTQGGTILGSSNRANPARFAVDTMPDGTPRFENVSDRCLKYIDQHKIEAIVVIGGDGSMSVAHELRTYAAERGRDLPFVGVPKTIDNDLVGTEMTFGFATAVATATDALDKVHTTAASHHRVMVVEVMGRSAGWIALHSGIASGSDVILVPEIPFHMESVADVVISRNRRGKRFTVVCAAEGAAPAGGEKIVAKVDPTSPDPIRLGGIGKYVADTLEKQTGVESRYVVLGHTQRGGTPVASDRVLSTQLGHAAMVMLKNGTLNRMVALQGNVITSVPISEVANRRRTITPDHPLLAAARAVYTSFGD